MRPLDNLSLGQRFSHITVIGIATRIAVKITQTATRTVSSINAIVDDWLLLSNPLDLIIFHCSNLVDFHPVCLVSFVSKLTRIYIDLDSVSLMLPLSTFPIVAYFYICSFSCAISLFPFRWLILFRRDFIFRDVRSRRGEVCKRQKMEIAHGGTE